MRTEDSTWLLRGFIICFLSYLTVAAETIKTTNSCLTTDKDQILLTCNSGEMIHVISFLYQTASEDCNTVDGECQVLQQSSDDGMFQNCNGNQICDETISNKKMKNECNHTTPVHVTLSYGCISESPSDVCTETNQKFDQQVYLSSPAYRKKDANSSLVPCECAISGSDLIVEILELNLPFFATDRANITLIGDSTSWTSSPVQNFLQYNKLVLNQTQNVKLFYDARQKTGQHMWLRVQGSANITVQCNRQPTTTPATTLSSPAVSQLNVTSAGLAAETIKTTNSCLTTDEDRMLLTCNPGEMIHVISFLYQTASEDCSTIDGDCQVLQQSSDDGMLLSCNGQQTCNESIINIKMKKECNHTTPVHVTIKYGCISESPLNVCTETSETFGQQVYLISPDYLKRNDDFPSVPCECEIFGSDISVEILELNLPFFSDDRANITLLGDSRSWSSNPVLHFLQYNMLVLNQTENVTLFYDARGKSGQHMWLRLQGSDDITVQCNRESTTSATTLTTYVYTTLNVTNGTPDTNTDENAEKQTVVLGILIGIIVLLVLVSGSILFFFLFIKPRRLQRPENGQKHVTGQNNEADVTTNYEEAGYYNVTNSSNTSTALELEPRMDVEIGNENYEHLTTYTNDPTNHDYSSLT